MAVAKLSSKGQLQIPKQVRDALSWPPGAEIEIEPVAGALVLRPVAPPVQVPHRDQLERVRRRIKYSGPKISESLWDKAIGESVRKDWNKGKKQ